jgi:Holliday junction resolvase RusA-like endonuclease
MSETSDLTRPVLRFTVHGIPAGQGSGRAFIHTRADGRQIARVTHDSAKTMPYRESVARVASLEARAAPEKAFPALRGTRIEIFIVFVLPKPASAPKRKETFPVKKPDIDKLCRAVLDALTGIVFEDDSQVVRLEARKEYGMPARTEITVEALR